LNDVSVRHAVTSDTRPIKDIIDLSFSRFFRFFASHSVGSEEGQVIVAESNSGIAGFAKLIEFHVGGVKYGCILWIAVHPAQRRRGIALKLANRGIELLKETGARAVFASTQRTNHASQRALAKAGFMRIGFLGLWRMFGWRLFGFYGGIWYAPNEIVFMHP
jgi:ribosomal protein S18 acetylase RimI-like enzyme